MGLVLPRVARPQAPSAPRPSLAQPKTRFRGRRLERPDSPRRGPWIALAYGGLGALGATLAEACGQSPWTTDAWAGTSGWSSFLSSLAFGGLIAVVTVRTTRVLGRARWARTLHADLRPVAHGLDDGAILLMAIASGLGEELFFRGWLTPYVGVLASAVAFGAVHQVRGRARWAWAAWAAVMGLAFGSIYRLTGNLAGPIVAHVTVNALNLRYLRDHDPEAKPKLLGGLLSR